MDTTDLKKPGLAFWLTWTCLNAAAWSICLAVNALIAPVDVTNMRGLWLFGPLVGGLQWLALRGYIRRAGWWALGCAVYGFLCGIYVLSSAKGVTAIFLLMVSITLVQYLALRRSMRMAWLWWLVTLVALGISAAASILPLFLVLLDGAGGAVSWAILGLIAGAVYGAVSGGALTWLLRKFSVAQVPALSPRGKTVQNVTLGVIGALLVFLPIYAPFRINALQNEVFCEVLEIGTSRAEVEAQLGEVRSISTGGRAFIENGETVNYPPLFKPPAAQVSEFVVVDLLDLLVVTPQLALGFDENGILTAISSDNRIGFQDYWIPTCPITLQRTWDTLFE